MRGAAKMKQSVKSILRFLFPEIQIVDAVKQEGFIAKKQIQQNSKHTGNSTIIGNTVIQSNGGSSKQNSVTSVNRTAAPKVEPTSSPVTVNADKINEKFEGIEQQLRQSWIASHSNILALCQAFKRPFVMEMKVTVK